MNKEYFKILKEINSLLLKKNEIQQEIDQENKRLIRIEDLRKSRFEESDDLQKSLEENQKRFTQIDGELSLLNKQKMQTEAALNAASTEAAAKASESQLKFLFEKIDGLESEQFSLLEEKEDLDQKLTEAQEFLEGSLESLNEIQDEVAQITLIKQNDISSLIKRMELLKRELPENFKVKLESLLKKEFHKSPFTRLEGHACEFCKRELSRMDEESIERNYLLKNCAGCGRLFIPLASAY